jgi:DNA repair photolyase
MIPTSHDITPAHLDLAMSVIGKLLVAGNRLLITTKPHLKCIMKICQAFKEYKEMIQFRFTITSKDDLMLAKWEPGAPLFLERVKALIFAFKAGFNTSISMEPCLDLDPRPLVERIAPYVTGKIWIGVMNYCGEYFFTKIETLQTWLGYFAGNEQIIFKDAVINRIEKFNTELKEKQAHQKIHKPEPTFQKLI